MRNDGLRSIVMATAREPQPQEVIVFRMRKRGNAIQAAPNPIKVARFEVVLQMRRAVSRLRGLSSREVTPLRIGKGGKGAKSGLLVAVGHA
jgi:hypothetical protein